jgi:hypothetical protein
MQLFLLPAFPAKSGQWCPVASRISSRTSLARTQKGSNLCPKFEINITQTKNHLNSAIKSFKKPKV